MSIVNKVTILITKVGIKYEIAKSKRRKDITKLIKQRLKELNKEIDNLLKD